MKYLISSKGKPFRIPDIQHVISVFYFFVKENIVTYPENNFVQLISLKLGLTVNTAIDPVLPVCKLKLVWKLLLDGSNAARILALDNIRNRFRQGKLMLLHDLCILNDIDGNAVIQNSQHIKINVKVTFDLNDVLAAHFIASCILDDSYLAV